MPSVRPITNANLGVNPDWAKLPLFDRKGWKRLPFGAFADSVNERVDPANAAEDIYVGLDDLDSGSLHIRRWGKGSDVIGTKLRFRKGDIIFGRRRAYQRKLAVAEMDGICSAHAMVVRAKQDVVLPEFLPFLMMSDTFMNRAVEISVGSLSPTINWRTLKLQEFDLPPLDQQRRIAEILWVVDSCLSKSNDLARDIHAALGASIDKQYTARSCATSEGVQVRMLDACQVMVSGVDKKSKRGERPILLCNYIDVYRNRYIRADMPFMEATALPREIFRHELKAGDILFTKDSEEANDIAVPALVTSDLKGVLCGYHLAHIRPDLTKVFPAYLLYLIRSTYARRYFSSRAKGITRFGLSISEIEGFRLILPPLNIQKKVSNHFAEIEAAGNMALSQVNAIQQLLNTSINSLLGDTEPIGRHICK
jgi:hypothetical protein